jgi:phosphoribosylpyrophosphate synthetase
MSLSQIHVLDKIIKKEHRNLRRELKILEIKKQVYNKVQLVVDDIVETYNDIMNRFMYEDKKLAYIRKR